MAGEFPPDTTVLGAVDEFADALTAAINTRYALRNSTIVEFVEGFWAPDPDAARHELADGCRPVLEVDPGALHALAEDLYGAVRLLDEGEPESGGFFEGFRAAPDQLAGWQGEAADAFRTQVSRIGKFASEQSRSITKAAGCLVAAFQVSALARSDLIAVLQAGTNACRGMAATDETQSVQAQLYVGAGLAAGTLNYIGTAAALARALGSAAQAIGTATTVQAASIGGSDPQDVLDRVVAEQRGVIERMHAAYADIVARTDKIPRMGAQPGLSTLLTALPPSTDVHSPAFDYLDFSSPWQTSGSFGDVVGAAADPEVTPARSGDVNRIRSALGGPGSK